MRPLTLRPLLALVLVALLLAVLPLPSAAGARKPADANAPTSVPFDLRDGYLILVQGRIGTLESLNFIVDTGQTRTAIDRSVAQRLHLPLEAEPDGKALSFDKAVSHPWAILPVLEIGAIQAENPRVLVEDLRYLRSSGVRVDAILGLDLLRTLHCLRIDFVAKRLVFNPTDQLAGRVLAANLLPWTMTVQIQVGAHPFEMVLDSGTRGALFYRAELDNHAIPYSSSPQMLGDSSGGMLPFAPALLPRIRAGSKDINRDVYLLASPSAAAPPGISGFLGLSTLHAKSIDLDFENQQVRYID